MVSGLVKLCTAVHLSHILLHLLQLLTRIEQCTWWAVKPDLGFRVLYKLHLEWCMLQCIGVAGMWLLGMWQTWGPGHPPGRWSDVSGKPQIAVN